MLMVSVLLLLLGLTNASQYSVTIMNDSSLSDKQGAVHTWLAIDSPFTARKYFSFETSYTGNVATGMDSPGQCTETSHIENRTPSESARVSITSEQYQQLVDSSDAFCANPPIYDLIPDNYENDVEKGVLQRERRPDYNCVTASNKILQSANIDIISTARTPYDVKQIFTGNRNWLQRLGVFVVNAVRKIPFAIMDAAQHSHPGY